ncbi:MAG: hypothetical protein MUC88_24015 [Planctomycetes bacterium]|jgi:hypothetical protein|nr:hypothetical protein [Planctomycetota bacterium]
MKITDTIQMLARAGQCIDMWVPHRGRGPDALIADVNDLCVGVAQNRSMEELFAYDDVGSPSLTLRVGIEEEFDLSRLMTCLRTKLRLPHPDPTDEIGNAGIVWSLGRYDFVYDSVSDSLRISHKYSHRRVDAKSVASIARQMIDYATDYLEAVKASARAGAAAPNSDAIRLPRASQA